MLRRGRDTRYIYHIPMLLEVLFFRDPLKVYRLLNELGLVQVLAMNLVQGGHSATILPDLGKLFGGE
jgi:hypothetical protein